jgi:ATP-dependent Clp protease protease subunit
MEATLRIYSVIGTEEDEFSSSNLINFLDNNKEATDLTIRIKSPGGSVREGWSIYDLLKNSGRKIKTIAEGELYSIATVIFLAGEEREMFPNADGLIHMPRIPNPEGDFQAADLREMAKYMDREEEKILNLYKEVTGKDEVTLREYMNKETMLSADDMLALGFATKITEPIKAVAYFNYKSDKMEKDELKTFGEKLETLSESVKALFQESPKIRQ